MHASRDICNISQDEATLYATQAADKFNLPQTVYKAHDSTDWNHTNSLAGVLSRADLAVTILPANYFQ